MLQGHNFIRTTTATSRLKSCRFNDPPSSHPPLSMLRPHASEQIPSKLVAAMLRQGNKLRDS